MPQERYSSPGVGSIVPLRSQHSRDISVEMVKNINHLLQSEGYLEELEVLPLKEDKLIVSLKDFIDCFPSRLHVEHWIDSGKQVSVIHPETYLPFFFNFTGSKIIRKCDGNHRFQDIIDDFQRDWPTIPEENLRKDFLRFLLVLEELDLINF